jgi:hypothetical protein
VKTLIDWLLAQRQRLVIVAIVTAPLLPIVAAALLALETARRGTVQGITSAAFGVAGLTLLAALSRTGVLAFALMGLVTMGAGVVIGALIRWAGNLVLAFQVVWLVCLVGVLVFAAAGPDPATLFAPVLAGFRETLQGQGLTAEQIDEVVAGLAQSLPAASLLLALGGTLLLAYWWWSAANGGPRLGAEFRRLKLGRWLGWTATVLLALGVAFAAPLVQNLLPMAVMGFLFQGLAVAHAWVHAKQWNPVVLVGLYVLLVVSPATVAVAIVGLVDNWLDLRKRLRSAA